MTVTAVIVLDTRRKKQDDTYPVKLRVTFERKQDYYPTKYSLTKEAYDRTMYGQRQNAEEKKLKKNIQAYEDKATGIIDKLSDFSWQAFEDQYYANRAAKDTLDAAFTEYANKLRSNEQTGTAVVYECAQNSLNKFKPGARFADVTVEFLQKYEKWMLDAECSPSTIGIYLRNLRTLYNIAIPKDSPARVNYPFGEKKYEIPTSVNTKRALTLKDIASIYYHKLPAGSTAEMARDYWCFIYFCNGLNMKDLCLLRYDNIKGNTIEFVRAKSARTKRKVEAIRVPMSEDLWSIIKRWGNKKEDNSTYIFPILTKGLNAERQRELIQLRTHLVNEHMKKIAADLGIDKKTTTYVARHSFADVLKKSGASIEFIGESMGHGDTKTTRNYLGSFEDEAKAETLKALTAFKTHPKPVHEHSITEQS